MQTLLRALFDQATTAPEREALLFRDHVVTYGELMESVQRAAAGLDALGLVKGDRLALYLPNSAAFAVAYYAALHLGLVVVPINASYGADELSYLLNDCEVACLVTAPSQYGIFQSVRDHCPSLREVVVVGEYQPGARRWAELAACADACPEVEVGLDDLAMVFYTSGTTGQAKGALATHRNIVTFCGHMQLMPRTAAQPGERTLLALPMFHMFGLFPGLHCPLLHGGSVVILERFTPEGYAQAVDRFKCRRLMATPPMVIGLLQLPNLAEFDLRGTRSMLSGGAPLPIEVGARFKELTGIDVDECYGSNEAFFMTSTAACDERRPGSAGKAVPGVEVRLVDDEGQDVPPGVEGEVIARGNSFPGYWNRGEESARVLAGGWCHTGDIARRDEDGFVTVVDRKKDMINVGGTKVWPREVDEVLFRHPAVREVAVVAWPDGTMGELPVAFVAFKQGANASEEELKAHCALSLARFKVPVRFFFRDSLPKLPSGKILRRALRDEARAIANREPAKRRGTGELVLPETLLDMSLSDREARMITYLRTKVARLLRVPASSLRDDASLIDLGLDSLMAIELKFLYEQDLGLVLPASIAWQHPTLRGLGVFLAERLSDEAPALPPWASLAPDASNRFQPFGLTDMQQAYWIGAQPGFDLSDMNAHVLLEADCEGLDLERLERAWNQVIERHDMLRAVIGTDGRQRILPQVGSYAIRIEDIRGLVGEARKQAVRAAHDRMAAHGRPMGEWPQFEILAQQVGETRYRLYFAINLAVCDGRSVHTLFKDWGRYYQGSQAALAPLEIGFREWVLEMERRKQSGSYQASLDHWKGRLETLPPPPDLPLANNPADIRPVRFDHLDGRLSAREWQSLKERARQAGVTPTAVLIAAFAETLAGWSRNAAFTLNLLFFNRQPLHPQIADVVGNLSSTMFLAVDATPEESFAARCRRLHRQLWADMEHAEVSGVSLVRELSRLRGWSSAAVAPIAVSSMLGLTDAEADAPWLPVWSDLARTHVQTPQVYLDHQVIEKDGALLFNWDYVRDLFPDGLVADMLASYRHLLERLATEDAAWDSAASSHLRQSPPSFLAEYNATERTFQDADALMHSLFERQAERTPESVAVVAPERTLTYREVQTQAHRLAHWLRDRSVRPNQLVAVVMDKGWEQIVAVLGIQAAGAAYLPIDPALPGERIHYLLSVTGATLAVTQPWLEERIDWPEGVTAITPEAPELAALSDATLPPVQSATDLAYVIFTSGSTGLPKGVMIDHRGAVNTILDLNERLGLTERDRILSLSALNFDLSVYDIFGPLAVGAAIVLPDARNSRDPQHWHQLLVEAGVTLWNSVPAMAGMLADYAELQHLPLPPSLRAMMFSGDWIPVSLADRLRALRPGLRVLGLGGATEASIWSISYEIETVDPTWRSIPYGRPLSNQSIHVLDEALEPCPVWRTGEIFIGGIGVALGYWKDEAKTTASFFMHPRTGERLYRTGDLGRFLPDGNVEFLGREDFQVKVQGYRIELGEIEAALEQHPEVRSAVVACWGERHARYLVGYVVPEHPGEAPSHEELRTFLRTKLPAYMVPVDFATLEAIPLSANGKVDRKALPRYVRNKAKGDRPYVPPRDETERELVRIWEALLDNSPIGVHDSFFDLGGQSLLAVRMISRLKDVFGRSVSLGTLLEGATIEQLAELLRTGDRKSASALVSLKPEGTRPPLFLVHPVGGSVYCYAGLARMVDADLPVYGLQSPGLDNPDQLLHSVEAMAELYMREITRVQPHGPYHFGGWSMGGVIAYELALRLADRGQETRTLVMIDSESPGGAKPPLRDDETDHLVGFMRDLAGEKGRRLTLTPDELRGLPWRQALAQLRHHAIATDILPADFEAERLEQLFGVYRANLEALWQYVPRPYSGLVTLLVAAERPDHPAFEPDLGWKPYAATLDLATVPGNHYSLMSDDHRPGLVRQLARRILEARGTGV